MCYAHAYIYVYVYNYVNVYAGVYAFVFVHVFVYMFFLMSRVYALCSCDLCLFYSSLNEYVDIYYSVLHVSVYVDV